MMKSYKITTKLPKSGLIFYTSAKKPLSALRHLIDNSYDFKAFSNEKRLNITIEEL